jgi:hypothetical protein
VRFFAPILGRLAWRAGIFVGSLVACYMSFRWAAHWTAAWAPAGSRWFEIGLATVTISWACASTLTLLVVMLGFVRMTRSSIGVLCGYFFTLYFPLLIPMRDGAGFPFSYLPPSVFLLLLPMFAMQEVVSHVKPWKNESWNGKPLRQRWNESWLGSK